MNIKFEVQVLCKSVHGGKYFIRTDDELHRALDLTLPKELFPAYFLVMTRERAKALPEPEPPGPILETPAPHSVPTPERTEATDAASVSARRLLGVKFGATSADVRDAFRSRMKVARQKPDHDKAIETLQAAFDRLVVSPALSRAPKQHSPNGVELDDRSVLNNSDSVMSSKVAM